MRKRVRIQVQLLPLRRAQTRGRRRLGASPDLARTTINNLRPSARKCRENVQSSPTNQLTETSPTTRSPQYDQQGGDRGFGGDRGGGGGGYQGGGGYNAEQPPPVDNAPPVDQGGY